MQTPQVLHNNNEELWPLKTLCIRAVLQYQILPENQLHQLLVKDTIARRLKKLEQHKTTMDYVYYGKPKTDLGNICKLYSNNTFAVPGCSFFDMVYCKATGLHITPGNLQVYECDIEQELMWNLPMNPDFGLLFYWQCQKQECVCSGIISKQWKDCAAINQRY